MDCVPCVNPSEVARTLAHLPDEVERRITELYREVTPELAALILSGDTFRLTIHGAAKGGSITVEVQRTRHKKLS